MPPPKRFLKKNFLHHLKIFLKKFIFTLLFKLLKLPPLSNSNPRNLIDYPPSKSCRKTRSTTPPPRRIHGTSSTTPLEIGPENCINYPPPLEFTAGTEIRPPPPNSIPRSATDDIRYYYSVVCWATPPASFELYAIPTPHTPLFRLAATSPAHILFHDCGRNNTGKWHNVKIKLMNTHTRSNVAAIIPGIKLH